MRRSVLARSLVVVLVAITGALVYVSETAPRTTSSAAARDAGAASIDAAAPRRLVSRAPRRDPRPDILLFTIDTLRADHSSAYRYDRETTPAIRALADRGTRFDRAYSTSSWTLPAVASLLTGVLPSEHGALHSDLSADRSVVQDHLAATLPSLPTALHDAGYRTIGVTANGHLLPNTGFARGFDDYECLGFEDADAVRTALSTRLEQLLASETPYFLWVHLVDPHAPFTPTEPQFSAWWPPSSPRYPALSSALYAEAIAPIIARDRLPVREAMGFVTAAYDSEIRRADDYLAHLLGELDDGHLAVVVTSDHGEELGDHFAIGHGHTLFEEVVHVPLVIALPQQTPSVAATSLVSILDVFPTLMELALRDAPSGLAGTSLTAALHGMELGSTRDIVMETGRGDQVVHGIFDGHYTYAEQLTPSPLEALFDNESDPSEVRDLFGAHPEIATPLRERMRSTLAAAAARHVEVERDTVELSDMLHDQLEALGYGH